MVVLDGGWDRVGRGEDPDTPRRLYYVAMTRARQTITLARLPSHHRLPGRLERRPICSASPPPDTLPTAAPELARLYRRLSLRDVFLSFAGYRPSGWPGRRAIASLSPGDHLQVRAGQNRWELLDRKGTVVGQLASGFQAPAGFRCKFATVLAIVTWSREKSEPEYQQGLLCDEWEVVAPELVFEPEA